MSSGGETPATATTGTGTGTATGTTTGADDEREDLGFHPADVFRDWASPEEVLQLRTLWADVMLKHKVELQKIVGERDKLIAERDQLAAQVQEGAQIQQLYLQGQQEFESSKVERARWREERQMLILQLQQLTNEKLAREMQTHQRNPAGGSDGSDRSLSLGSGSSAASAQQEVVMQAIGLLDENVQLHEQLRRAEWAVKETEGRMEVSSSLGTVSLQRLEQRIQSITAENQVFRTRTTSLQDQLQQSEHRCATLEQQLAAAEENSLRAVRDAHRYSAEALDRAQTALDAMHHNPIEEELQAKCLLLQRQLNTALDDRTQQSDRVAVEVANNIEMVQKLSQSHATEVSGLLEELQVEKKKVQLAASSSHEALKDAQVRTLAAEERALKHERRVAELQSTVTSLSQELDESSRTSDALKVDLSRTQDQLFRVANELETKQVTADAIANLQAEKEALLGRLSAMEEEHQNQKDFYERQTLQAAKAMELMQVKYDGKADLLVQQLYKSEARVSKLMKHRKRSTHAAVASNADGSPKSPGSSSSTDSGNEQRAATGGAAAVNLSRGGERHSGNSSGSPTGRSSGDSTAGARLSTDISLPTGGVDPVALMRSHEAMTRQVAKMIDRNNVL